MVFRSEMPIAQGRRHSGEVKARVPRNHAKRWLELACSVWELQPNSGTGKPVLKRTEAAGQIAAREIAAQEIAKCAYI